MPRLVRMPPRGDRAAVVVLASLPVAIFVLPALAGHPVLPGDDLTQNFPLRVLAGSLLRHGHLPLYDPYLWSGAPLLGGWNAAAAYPLTWVFAVLPGVAAWTFGLAFTWWTAGLGMFAFLRASRLSPAAGFLGALSFAFAGAMAAQVPHFGLVAGMSWVPLALLALLRLSGARAAGRLAWAAVLAGAAGLVILAGEPRAIDDAAVVICCYAGWRMWRLRRWPEVSGYLAAVLGGLALGVALGAVQWLPGMAAVHTSQRVALSTPAFDSGSLPRKWLLLSLVPDLLGGSGSFGQPAFLGNYNLTEVTGYVGLMPLVAACALLGQGSCRRRGRPASCRRRARPASCRRRAGPAGRPVPEWLIWHLVAVAGVFLALGGNTAPGVLLAHVPFFGDQRLQSRNIVIADLALAVLLGYWADRWLRAPPAPAGQRVRGRLAALAPAAVVAGVVAATLAGGAGMWHWLGLSAVQAGHAGPLRPWLAPSLVLAAGAAYLAWWGPRLRRRARARALLAFVCADITVFALLAVVAVAPGLGRAGARSAAGGSRPRSRVVPAGAFTHGGRFAVYDPGLADAAELPGLGVPDGNVISGTPSVQGYGSIVDAGYAAATGSHRATGEGQNVLSPRAVGDGALDQLDTTVLFTPAAYLITPASHRAAPRGRSPGLRAVPPHRSATWYFGPPLDVTSVTIPASGVLGSPRPALRIALLRPSGPESWLPVRRGTGGLAAATGRPQPAVGVRVMAGPGRLLLGPPVIGAAHGASFRADGQLQGALVPPRWRFAGQDGAFAVFADARARPPLALRPPPHRPLAGAHIRAIGGPRFAPSSALVSSAAGATVIRAVASIPGWTASWRPERNGAARVLPVRRWGLVQAVTVPAGRGTISWAYDPPGAKAGLWLSLTALAVLAGLVAIVAAARHRRRRIPAVPGGPQRDRTGEANGACGIPVPPTLGGDMRAWSAEKS
jgi:hypothetical protein